MTPAAHAAMEENIVTKIERQKGARHRVSVFLDGEFAFGADEELVYTFRLAKGAALDAVTVARLTEEDAFCKTRDTAMRILARRKHSIREMRTKLERKGCGAAAIDRVISHLQSIALLDDADYARAYVTDRLNLRPAGRRTLEVELRRRGVDEEIISSILAKLVSDSSEEESALRLAEKYIARTAHVDPETRSARLYRFLLRRGYEPGVIRRAVEKSNE